MFLPIISVDIYILTFYKDFTHSLSAYIDMYLPKNVLEVATSQKGTSHHGHKEGQDQREHFILGPIFQKVPSDFNW